MPSVYAQQEIANVLELMPIHVGTNSIRGWYNPRVFVYDVRASIEIDGIRVVTQEIAGVRGSLDIALPRVNDPTFLFPPDSAGQVVVVTIEGRTLHAEDPQSEIFRATAQTVVQPGRPERVSSLQLNPLERGDTWISGRYDQNIFRHNVTLSIRLDWDEIGQVPVNNGEFRVAVTGRDHGVRSLEGNQRVIATLQGRTEPDGEILTERVEIIVTNRDLTDIEQAMMLNQAVSVSIQAVQGQAQTPEPEEHHLENYTELPAEIPAPQMSLSFFNHVFTGQPQLNGVLVRYDLTIFRSGVNANIEITGQQNLRAEIRQINGGEFLIPRTVEDYQGVSRYTLQDGDRVRVSIRGGRFPGEPELTASAEMVIEAQEQAAQAPAQEEQSAPASEPEASNIPVAPVASPEPTSESPHKTVVVSPENLNANLPRGDEEEVNRRMEVLRKQQQEMEEAWRKMAEERQRSAQAQQIESSEKKELMGEQQGKQEKNVAPEINPSPEIPPVGEEAVVPSSKTKTLMPSMSKREVIFPSKEKSGVVPDKKEEKELIYKK
ncbi:MAG: hypothetical protein NUV91_02420 [Candidatus Omnitrophica bacterium]|nr:hypothetical protein [Candidatus Omnitrophota bacterium]